MSAHDWQQNETIPVQEAWKEHAHIKNKQYLELYQKSIEDPDAFWAEAAQRIDWIKPFTQVKDVSFAKDDVHIRWFHDGTLNVCYNCVDRHLDTKGDDVAIIWEGDDPANDEKITYRQLHERVSKFANALKARGVKKGDRVSIYMPMIPEATVAMLACTRIGAVHSIVFSAFSPDALASRIQDSDCQVVITSDVSVRTGKHLPLKKNADKVMTECPDVSTMLVVLFVVVLVQERQQARLLRTGRFRQACRTGAEHQVPLVHTFVRLTNRHRCWIGGREPEVFMAQFCQQFWRLLRIRDIHDHVGRAELMVIRWVAIVPAQTVCRGIHGHGAATEAHTGHHDYKTCRNYQQFRYS